MTLNRKSQGQGHRERSQLRRSHQGLFPCNVSSLYWLIWPRTNLNAKVNQNYKVTLNRKSQGQGHRERSQFRRSHQGIFPCKVSSLYWLMWSRTNLNAEVNQMLTDRRTDRQTDRRTSSIHKPELLCNPANYGDTCVLMMSFHIGLRAFRDTILVLCLAQSTGIPMISTSM